MFNVLWALPKWECTVGTWDLLTSVCSGASWKWSICESCKDMDFVLLFFRLRTCFFNCLPCAHLARIRKSWTNNNKTTPNPPKHAVVTVNTWALVTREDSGSAHWVSSCLYGCWSGRWLKLYGCHVLNIGLLPISTFWCVCVWGETQLLISFSTSMHNLPSLRCWWLGWCAKWVCTLTLISLACL